MKLHTRWQQTRFGLFWRRTEFELYCRVELSEAEARAYSLSGLGRETVCEYRSHGLRLDTRLADLIAAETRFGSEDRAYLEKIEKVVSEAVARLTETLRRQVPFDESD